MSYYPSSNRDNQPLWLVLLVLLVLLGIGAITELPNRVTVSGAVDRFYELSQAKSITVVRYSNNAPIFGDTRDVTFELTVDGQPQTGRCTSGFFSPMVCRLYTGGD